MDFRLQLPQHDYNSTIQETARLIAALYYTFSGRRKSGFKNKSFGELRWGVLGSRVHEESLQYKCVPPWITVSLLTEAL